MKRRDQLLVPLALSLVLTLFAAVGCAYAEGWVIFSGEYIAVGKVLIKVTTTWRLSPAIEDQILLTKNGMWLQLFRIGRVPIERAFSNTNKKVSKQMSAEELAELAVNDFRANRSIANFQLLESATIKLAGFPAPKITYSYEGDANVRKMGIYSGVVIDESLYFFHYHAPARHYFERDRATFEDVLNSVSIGD